MDNGEVIPGLNESWNFCGAKLFEWLAGFVMFMMAGQTIFVPVGKHMPHLMISWVVTTFGLKVLRQAFPDEERGVRNFFMTKMGISPPGIPTPAPLQPYWSGAPVRALTPECDFERLGLIGIFEASDQKDGSALPR